MTEVIDTVAADATTPRLELPAELVIANVAAVKAALDEALLAKPSAIELDAGGVVEVDTAGMQLLGAFARECGEREITLEFRDAVLVESAFAAAGWPDWAGAARE